MLTIMSRILAAIAFSITLFVVPSVVADDLTVQCVLRSDSAASGGPTGYLLVDELVRSDTSGANNAQAFCASQVSPGIWGALVRTPTELASISDFEHTQAVHACRIFAADDSYLADVYYEILPDADTQNLDTVTAAYNECLMRGASGFNVVPTPPKD